MRRPQHRAVVVVAEREGVGQRVIEGDVLPAVVAHGEHTVLGPLKLVLGVRADEGAVGAVVPTHVLALPAVVEVGGAFADAGRGVEVEGEQRRVAPPGPRLGEVPELAVRVVVEAPDPGIRAVVVVEGAVLLHQEDDVLNGSEIRAGRLGARRELGHGGAGALAPAGRGHDRRAASRQRGSQQRAPIEAGAVEGPVRCHPAFRVIPPPRVRRRCCGRCRRAARRGGARRCRRGAGATAPATPRRPRWPGRATRRRWQGRG